MLIGANLFFNTILKSIAAMILFLSIALNISYLFNVKEICSPIFINMSVFIFSCIAILDGSFLKIKNKLESNPYSTGVKYSSMTNKILLFFVILLLICNFSNCFFNDQLVKEEKDSHYEHLIVNNGAFEGSHYSYQFTDVKESFKKG